MAELLSNDSAQDEEVTDEMIAIQSAFGREMTDLFFGIDFQALSEDQKTDLNALLAENMAEITRSSLSDMSAQKQEEIKEHLMFKIRPFSIIDRPSEFEEAVEETCADVAKIPLSKMDFDVLRILINEDHLDNLTVRAQRMKRMLEIDANPLPSQVEEQEYLAIQAEFEREMTELLDAAGIDVDALPEDQKFELKHSIIAKNMAQVAFLAACIV